MLLVPLLMCWRATTLIFDYATHQWTVVHIDFNLSIEHSLLSTRTRLPLVWNYAQSETQNYNWLNLRQTDMFLEYITRDNLLRITRCDCLQTTQCEVCVFVLRHAVLALVVRICKARHRSTTLVQTQCSSLLLYLLEFSRYGRKEFFSSEGEISDRRSKNATFGKSRKWSHLVHFSHVSMFMIRMFLIKCAIAIGAGVQQLSFFCFQVGTRCQKTRYT